MTVIVEVEKETPSETPAKRKKPPKKATTSAVERKATKPKPLTTSETSTGTTQPASSSTPVKARGRGRGRAKKVKVVKRYSVEEVTSVLAVSGRASCRGTHSEKQTDIHTYIHKDRRTDTDSCTFSHFYLTYIHWIIYSHNMLFPPPSVCGAKIPKGVVRIGVKFPNPRHG